MIASSLVMRCLVPTRLDLCIASCPTPFHDNDDGNVDDNDERKRIDDRRVAQERWS